MKAAELEAANIAAAQQRKREHDEVIRLAKDPVLQSTFRCFLDKGYVAYNVHPGGAPRKGRAAPFGIGLDLNKHGWLSDSKAFAKAMAGRANTDLYNNFTDRRHYPYPRTAAEWDEIDRLLVLFKKVGPVWVEMSSWSRDPMSPDSGLV